MGKSLELGVFEELQGERSGWNTVSEMSVEGK